MIKIYTSVDLKNQEVKNVKLQTTQPSTPVEGLIYYEPGSKKVRYYDGTSWVSVGDSSGSGGEVNVLETIKVNNTSLTSPSKIAKLDFSTNGTGTLTIKDGNNSNTLATLNIGSSGVSAGDLVAVGTLAQGKSTYTLINKFNTEYVIVQVIDNDGNTVGCNVRRYQSSGNHYIDISFSSTTTQTYRVIVMGNANYSSLTEKVN